MCRLRPEYAGSGWRSSPSANLGFHGGIGDTDAGIFLAISEDTRQQDGWPRKLGTAQGRQCDQFTACLLYAWRIGNHPVGRYRTHESGQSPYLVSEHHRRFTRFGKDGIKLKQSLDQPCEFIDVGRTNVPEPPQKRAPEPLVLASLELFAQ